MTSTTGGADALADFAVLLDSGGSGSGGPPVDPSARRRRRLRALLVTGIVLAVLAAAVGGYVAWALNAPIADPIVTTAAPAPPQTAAVGIPLPTDGLAAVSVSGADEYLGPTASGVWASTGTDEVRPIASITKLVTALVVLEAYPLGVDDPGPTLYFSEADEDLYDEYYVVGATIAPMPAGSSMSLRSALAIMLIPSATNYADVIARWAFGSHGAFLDAAERWLAAHGLSRTTIVEPTGLDPGNTSSPGDLIALGRLALAHPLVAAISASPSVAVPEAGTMFSTNSLLGVDGVTGLKTGTFGAGSVNLLYSATLNPGTPNPLTVVGVRLGGSTRESVNAGVRDVLGAIAAGFTRPVLAEGGEQVGTIEAPWGSSARLVIGESASALVWSDAPVSVALDTTAPVTWEDGEAVGTVTWTVGPETVTAPVELDGGITPPTAWWRLTHPAELG